MSRWADGEQLGDGIPRRLTGTRGCVACIEQSAKVEETVTQAASLNDSRKYQELVAKLLPLQDAVIANLAEKGMHPTLSLLLWLLLLLSLLRRMSGCSVRSVCLMTERVLAGCRWAHRCGGLLQHPVLAAAQV